MTDFRQALFELENQYAHGYMKIVMQAILYEKRLLVPVDNLKQAFYMAFAWLKRAPHKDPMLCQQFLEYGLKHYPDAGFQEMESHLNSWIKTSQANRS